MIQIGNGNWAVKEDNLLGFRYDETEGVYFPREMTFGRACDATRVNPDGLIETKGSDIARIDYSSGTGALLLEPQRTNLVTYDTPSNFSAAVPRWTNGTSNPAVINQAVGIYGTETATKYTKTPGNTSADYLYFQRVPVVSGSVYTVSGYIKLGTASNAVVVINNTTAWDSVVGANLVATASGGYDQWKRFEITFTAPASNYVNIHLGYHQETGVTAQADGTFFIQGVQLELGSYATSIIQTNGTTVTRLADTCYKTGVADWIGQTEGTLFVDFIYKTTDQTRVSISDGSSTNWIFIGIPDSSTHSRLYIRTNGTVQVDTSSNLLGIFTSGQRYKIALAYKSGDWAIAVNGTIKTSGSQTFSPSAAFNTIVLTGNSSAASSQLGLNQMNHATLYKTRLSNSELAALTTI